MFQVEDLIRVKQSVSVFAGDELLQVEESDYQVALVTIEPPSHVGRRIIFQRAQVEQWFLQGAMTLEPRDQRNLCN
jgi:hypothetical protein